MSEETCPWTKGLDRYRSGELSPSDAERWRAHLAQCSACQEALAAVSAAMATTKTWGKSRPPAGGAARAVGASRPPEPLGEDLAGYLTPPQSPGELGRLGEYRVLKVLGRGGMGVVLLGED